MPTTEIFQKCAGGCGAERKRTGRDAELCRRYNLAWWCEPCGDRKVDEALLGPILSALLRQPHLRAKLHEILEMK